MSSQQRRPHRWSKRTSALRAIHKMQRCSDSKHMVKGAPFERIARDCASGQKHGVRMTAEFLYGLRESTEDQTHDIDLIARRLCEKDGRQVVQDRDIQAAASIAWNPKNNVLLANNFPIYMKVREALGMDPRLKIGTDLSESGWVQERARIHEENRTMITKGKGKKKDKKKVAQEKSSSTSKTSARGSGKRSREEEEVPKESLETLSSPRPFKKSKESQEEESREVSEEKTAEVAGLEDDDDDDAVSSTSVSEGGVSQQEEMQVEKKDDPLPNAGADDEEEADDEDGEEDEEDNA